jgi:DNA-binding transcriptional regulator YiaG
MITTSLTDMRQRRDASDLLLQKRRGSDHIPASVRSSNCRRFDSCSKEATCRHCQATEIEIGTMDDKLFAKLIESASQAAEIVQGRRRPDGPAAALLTAIKNDPTHVVAAQNPAA